MFGANRLFNGKRQSKAACGCGSKRGRFLRMEPLEDRRLLAVFYADDMSTLVQAINSANQNTSVDDLYLLDNITLNGDTPTITQSLMIHGNGYTIDHIPGGTYSRFAFYMNAAAYALGDLQISDLTVIGDRFGRSVVVDFGRDITIVNCQFANNLGPAIEIGMDVTIATIGTCYIDGCGFYSDAYGIRAHAQTSSIMGIEVTNCHFGSDTYAGMNDAAMEFQGSGQRTITNNQMVGGGYGIWATATSGYTGFTFDIEGNKIGAASDLSTVIPNSKSGISIDNSGSGTARTITIANNYLWGNGCTISGGVLVPSSYGGDGITLSNCHDVTITGNNIGGYKSGSGYVQAKNGGYGASLSACTNVTFTANIVVGNEYSGLRLNGCTTATVAANASSVINEFFHNGVDATSPISTTRAGISVNDSDHVTITSTLFNQNVDYGVEVGGGSTDVVIANSTFYANGNDAIATLNSSDDQVLVDNNSYQYTSYYNSTNIPIDIATNGNAGITTPTIDAVAKSGSNYLVQLTANLPSTYAGATVSFEIYRYRGGTSYYGRYDALGSASGTLNANGDLTGVVTLSGLVAGDQITVHITIPYTGTPGRSSEFCTPVTLPAAKSASRFSTDTGFLANTALSTKAKALTFTPAGGANREWDWLLADEASQVPAVRPARTAASAVDSLLATGWASGKFGYDDVPDNDAYSSAALDDALLEPLFSGPKGGLGF